MAASTPAVGEEAGLPSSCPKPFSFHIDGKLVDATWLRYLEGDTPRPSGEVWSVDRQHLVIEEPVAYKFRTDEGGNLWEIQGPKTSKKKLRSLHLSVQWPDLANKETGKDAMPSLKVSLPGELSSELLRDVRRLSISDWSEEMRPVLDRLDLQKVFVSLQFWDLGAGVPELPELPPAIRYLELKGKTRDMMALAKLTQLEVLLLEDARFENGDLSFLARVPLQLLSLPYRIDAVTNLEAIGTLSSLRTLFCSGASYLGEAKWLSDLTELRVLAAGNLAQYDDKPVSPLDLQTLGSLPHLTRLAIQNTAFSSLPDFRLPSLAWATLLGSSGPDEAKKAFIAANPQCRFWASRTAEFDDAISKADRVVVRPDPDWHHRTIGNKKPTLVITKAEDIKQISVLLKVEESQDGGFCGCHGSQHFEFYRGNTLLAHLSYHHGKTLRWSGGRWPGDGVLREGVPQKLAQWLHSRGYPYLLTEQKLQLESRREEERTQREQLDRDEAVRSFYRRVLSDEEISELQAIVEGQVSVQDDDEEAAIPTEKHNQLCRLLLKAYGAGTHGWAVQQNWDREIGDLLDKVILIQTFHTVIESLDASQPEVQGAARWLFGGLRVIDWKDKEPAALQVAKAGLRHPRQVNRWSILFGLRDLGTNNAVHLLRQILSNGCDAPALATKDLLEDPGEVRCYGLANLMPDTPDQAIAALCLLMLRDSESLHTNLKIISQLPQTQQDRIYDSLNYFRVQEQLGLSPAQRQ